MIEPEVDPRNFKHAFEVSYGFVELFFAGNLLGHIELASDLRGGIKQGNGMSTSTGFGRKGHPRRTGSDHGDVLGAVRGLEV